MAPTLKPLSFVGSSRDDLRRFPAQIRRLIGVELMAVQFGSTPSDFKPMPTIGAGVYEIRVRLRGAYRVIYLAKLEEAVYVLHVFQKKSQRTSRTDLDIASTRYKAVWRLKYEKD